MNKTIILILITFYALVTCYGQQVTKNVNEEIFAIRNVNIIPMTTGNKVIENAILVIKCIDKIG